MRQRISGLTLIFLIIFSGIFPVKAATNEGYGEDQTSLGQFVDSFEDAGNVSVTVNVIRNSTLNAMELNYSSGGGANWLAGWDFRVKLTIDQNDIDSALSDFPVLIYISSSSGRNNDDVTFIFDEVGANSLKIAVTENDGTTECYVEIEEWDLGNEKAWLHSNIPSIASGEDTDFYFYYDNDHADNVAHVGIKESASGENVWDSDFLMVQHMDEASGTIKDSTSEDRDGTQGRTPTYGQTGEIDGAIEFDGTASTGDYFQLADHADLSFTAFTWETWVYLHDKTADNPLNNVAFGKAGGAGTREWQFVFTRSSGGNPFKVKPVLGKADGNWGLTSFESTGTIALNAWKYVAITWDGSTVKIYLEGVFDSQVGYSLTIKDTTRVPYIAKTSTTWQHTDGLLDEDRLSSIAREPEWIKATFETGRDDLIDWSIEETSPGYSSDGYFSTVDYLSDPLANGSALTALINTSIPANTQILVEFSEDNITWVFNDWQPLFGGFEAVDLRDLNYSAGYHCRFNLSTTDASFTPRVYQNRVITMIGTGGITMNQTINLLNGTWVDYNLTEIGVTVGTLDAGNLASTYFIDGDMYNVSEIAGAPGMQISANVTGIDDNSISLWITIYGMYDGNLAHDFDIEVWNFTSGAWMEDDHIPDQVVFEWTNSTIYGLQVPLDFLDAGEVRVRLDHESAGNINHDLFIDYMRVQAFIPSVSAPTTTEEFQFFWIVLAIALMLIGIVISKMWFEEGDS